MPIIIANTFIGIIQEIRSKKVLDKLSVLNASRSKVIRDGQIHTVLTTELVQGDLVILGAGNQIAADALVEQGEIQVNESLITGESDEVTKRKGDELLSGSFVVSGECKAILNRVGHESYVAKLTMEAKKTKNGVQSEMIRSLNKLVKVIGILLIPLGLALFAVQHWVLGNAIDDSVIASTAALIGMIPEGLYLLASVALVVSVMLLARKKVLVHEMSCIETLARVDVLCVDKTGTITEPDMKVNELIPLDHYLNGTYVSLHELMGNFAHSMSADNNTMEALKLYFQEPATKTAITTTSFSSACKYSSATYDDGVYVLGAPEFVLRDGYQDYQELIEKYSNNGYRVLVFGSYEGVPDGGPLTGEVIALSLVIISNPIREDARETFEYFASQGVDIKVISGDNPLTVSKVASKAGIENADNYIDAQTLETDEQIKEAILNYTVFGRVTPKQKRQFVIALKEHGKTVAMTGDGVNDVLALKEADCSVAMASGSEAASNVAQLVLLESNFACMPSVVLEGRRVVNNIQRIASLFLVKNIFSLLVTLTSLMFTFRYPLVPSHLSLLGLFTIGVPGFFLALQPNKHIIKGHFMTNVLLKALPAGLTDYFAVIFLVFLSNYINIPDHQLSTIAIILLLAIGYVTLLRISIPFDPLRIAIAVSMLICIFISLFGFSKLFAIYAISPINMVLMFILIGIFVPGLFLVSHIIDLIINFAAKHNRHFRKSLGRS